MENGKITRVRAVAKRAPVEDYLRPQARFRHLFRTPGGDQEIHRIQEIADANAERFGLGPVEAPQPVGA